MNQAVLGRSTNGTAASLAGDILDAEHPLDVVLAIPPEHYYEYDTDLDEYVARFYVDEGSGGVLGANSWGMMCILMSLLIASVGPNRNAVTLHWPCLLRNVLHQLLLSGCQRLLLTPFLLNCHLPPSLPHFQLPLLLLIRWISILLLAQQLTMRRLVLLAGRLGRNSL